MLKPNFIGIDCNINSGELADLQFTKNGENFGVFGPLDPQKRDFRKMNFNLHSPEVFSMLKPNFIGIGREINSRQLLKLQFMKNDENFGVFGPLDPPIAIFAKWTSTCTDPRYFLC